LAKLRESFAKKKLEMVVVGLENSGKTTLVNLIALGKVVETAPTVGLNIKQMKHKGVQMKAWDLGGQAAYREEWARYARGCGCILFIVDVADAKNINQARYELHRLLDREELHRVPLLVVGNKVDVEPHLPVEDLVKGLNLDYITENPWEVVGISAMKKTNLEAVLSWLIKHGK